jgi:hypothetical protein
MFKINIFLILLSCFLFVVWLLRQTEEVTPPSALTPLPLQSSEEPEIPASSDHNTFSEEEKKSNFFPLAMNPLPQIAEGSPEDCEITEQDIKTRYPLLSHFAELQEKRQKYFHEFYKEEFKKSRESKEQLFLYSVASTISFNLPVLLSAEQEMKTLDNDGVLLIRETLQALNYEYTKLLEDFTSDLLTKRMLNTKARELFQDYEHQITDHLNWRQNRELMKIIIKNGKRIQALDLEREAQMKNTKLLPFSEK